MGAIAVLTAASGNATSRAPLCATAVEPGRLRSIHDTQKHYANLAVQESCSAEKPQ